MCAVKVLENLDRKKLKVVTKLVALEFQERTSLVQFDLWGDFLLNLNKHIWTVGKSHSKLFQ